MVVLLRGAHPAAVRALVETLLEGHAPTDPEAPCVRVCFTPHELLDAPVGARVVLVGAGQAPEWLNINRPVVRERELVLFLWVADGELEPLRRSAPDFLDWVSHRIEVPWFAPAGAVAELERALARVKWIAVAGAELVEVAAEGRRKLDAKQHYDDLASAMESGDVAVRGLASDDDLWRLMLAHAEVQWCHRVVLVEPGVLPPLVWVIDGRTEDWEQRATRLESLGVEHARLVAALGSAEDPPRTPLAGGLAIDGLHMDLLGCVARAQVDHTTVRLALDLGLDDVAEGLGPTTRPYKEITPERIEQGLHGGRRERRALADYVTSVIDEAIIDQFSRHTADLSLMPDAVQGVLGELYRDDGELLRAWRPQRGSFHGYLHAFASQQARGRLALEHRRRSELASATSIEERSREPDAELFVDLDRVESLADLDRVLAVLDENDRAFLRLVTQGFSISEIGNKLGYSTNHARVRKIRLIRKIRNLLEAGAGGR